MVPDGALGRTVQGPLGVAGDTAVVMAVTEGGGVDTEAVGAMAADGEEEDGGTGAGIEQ